MLETNKFAESYSYFDARGLGLRSAVQTPDGWSISAVEYDNLGRVKKSYNPFYGSTPTATIPGTTKYTEVTAIDALGRTTSLKLQDDTTVSTYFSVAADIPSGFNKTFVRVTDQAGKQRRQVRDALGRIVRVDEPDVNGSLGAVDASLPLQQTSYEYDGNDNLSRVLQSDGTTTQERKFKYDSLSRLVAEKQVEATATLDDNGAKQTSGGLWTKVLKYGTHGLLTDGYDARGVRTHMSYDGLNRVQSVTYSGETGYTTPNVTYTYDQARTGFFNTGALTRVETTGGSDGISTASEFDYDLMGRVKKHRQYIAGQEYDLEYTYNLAGQLVSEKYPSGRIVTNSFDANGRLSSIADASRTYLNGLQYQGKGNVLSQMNFGNSTIETFTLNDRLQMSNQTLSKGSEVLQKYDYGYGQIDGSGNLDVTKNNGQLGKIESYIGAAKQWTQKFNYDSIGRLAQSAEYRGDNSSLTYKQTFDFDRFGNMYRKALNNGTSGQANPLPYTPIEDSDISKSTNRFTTNTTYDAAGNVVTDNKFRTMNFGYDANGRMVKAIKTSIPDALSVYDASGLRVAEKVNDIWRFLVYDAGGKLVAEYGGLQATDDGGVKYLLSDWQGSTRCGVSNSGFVQARADYSAFGEEIQASVGLRTVAQGFGSSNNVRQKYGLTERDDSTGLDHAWFRKHENRAGRWTSPDSYNGSIGIGDPQSFNRYTYVENQPTNFVDPSGLNMEFIFCEADRWDPGTGTLYIGRCFRYVMGGDSTIGTTITTRDPFEPAGGGGEIDCPNPQTPRNGASITSTQALNHYLNGSGSALNMNLSEINAAVPSPDSFPTIQEKISKGTKKPFEQVSIVGATSSPVATSGDQAAFLGRITFNATGVLNLYMTGDYQFYGSIGVNTDNYDPDPDRANGNDRRTPTAQFSTDILSLLPGKTFDIHINGRFNVDVQGNSRDGMTSYRCR